MGRLIFITVGVVLGWFLLSNRKCNPNPVYEVSSFRTPPRKIDRLRKKVHG